jgi:2-C-methyl-D-erythritol 4-phosphate cytidylyltransferase
VLQALEDPDVAGAICAVPVADTLKEVDDARVVRATVPRDGLVAVQTPQAFRREVLEQAHAGAGDATDDAGLVEHLGATVVVVEGDHDNIKITTPADLSYAAHLFGA